MVAQEGPVRGGKGGQEKGIKTQGLMVGHGEHSNLSSVIITNPTGDNNHFKRICSGKDMGRHKICRCLLPCLRHTVDSGHRRNQQCCRRILEAMGC